MPVGMTIDGIESLGQDFSFEYTPVTFVDHGTYWSATSLPGNSSTQSRAIALVLHTGPPVPLLVWATRRDFAASDFITAGAGGPLVVGDVRYLVRDVGEAWAVGDEFTDEDGSRRFVKGIAKVGRGRFLELFARNIGG